MSDQVRVAHLPNYLFLVDLLSLDVPDSLHLDSRKLDVSKKNEIQSHVRKKIQRHVKKECFSHMIAIENKYLVLI